jgi:hypothetical protein
LASRLHALPWRLGMISLAGNTAVSIFRFEVSGWDKRQSFFVEKSELHWGEQSGKQIALSSAIPDGAVVFLRLLPSLCADRSESVAYQTEYLQTTVDGRRRAKRDSDDHEPEESRAKLRTIFRGDARLFALD